LNIATFNINNVSRRLPNLVARDAGLRLDHLLHSPVLAKGLVDAGVDRDVRGAPGASDHAPAWAVLRRPPRG
jgi:exodeoxyribonuclease III